MVLKKQTRDEGFKSLSGVDEEKKELFNQRKKIVSAGFVVFRKTLKGPRFLLLYRGRNVWDMPRGRMEAYERSLQTAFREVKEETGLRRGDLDIKKNFKVFEKFPYSSGRQKIFKIVIFYLAETNQSNIKISPEHEGYAWFNLNEACRHLRDFQARQRILKKAFNLIKNNQA